MEHKKSTMKWLVLATVILSNMLIMAIPAMGMSVMAKEISQDLKLSLVQVGMVWGVGSLPSIVTGIFGGAFGDKLGPKKILIWGCLLGGLLGAARGLAVDYVTLLGIVIVAGAVVPFVSMNGFKVAGQWFPGSELALANGLISAGMALGFLLGAMLSATVLSPLLGGWRSVLLLYGLLGAGMSLVWLFLPHAPHQHHHGKSAPALSLRQTVLEVMRLKNIWLMGLTLFCVAGSIQGLLGYLPIYLRSQGWPGASADGAVSAFHLLSMIFVIPITMFSNRLGSRRPLLVGAALMVALGAGLLSFVSGGMVWVAVLMSGFVRDAFMAIFLTAVIETEGVGPAFAGTATGFTISLSSIGSFIAPPVGNSLAALFPGAPFAFWSVLTVLGIVFVSFVKSEKHRVSAEILEEVFEKGQSHA